jgi:hypothetical protein
MARFVIILIISIPDFRITADSRLDAILTKIPSGMRFCGGCALNSLCTRRHRPGFMEDCHITTVHLCSLINFSLSTHVA